MMVHARGAISGLPSKSILITDLSIKRLIFNVIVILLIGKLYIYACLKVWHKNIDFYNNVLTVFCNKSFFFCYHKNPWNTSSNWWTFFCDTRGFFSCHKKSTKHYIKLMDVTNSAKMFTILWFYIKFWKY